MVTIEFLGDVLLWGMTKHVLSRRTGVSRGILGTRNRKFKVADNECYRVIHTLLLDTPQHSVSSYLPLTLGPLLVHIDFLVPGHY